MRSSVCIAISLHSLIALEFSHRSMCQNIANCNLRGRKIHIILFIHHVIIEKILKFHFFIQVPDFLRNTLKYMINNGKVKIMACSMFRLFTFHMPQKQHMSQNSYEGSSIGVPACYVLSTAYYLNEENKL